MVTVRSAKQKGNAFEYDCQASLYPIYNLIYRTAERGFQRQYDLRDDRAGVVFECKRLKGISWSQAKKYFMKLVEKADVVGHNCYLLFKSNQQPCLVMYYNLQLEKVVVQEFNDVFNTPFVKHTSTRAK